MAHKRSLLVSTGHYVPEKIVTNHDLAKTIDTSHEWIVQRTGIHKRHIAADTETTADLATKAANHVLDKSGYKVEDIDLIIVATSSPEKTFPATATRVQHNLGIHRGVAFDVQAACAGFVFALSIADHMLRLGTATCALVIGADLYSRIVDWNDRKTCVLFSDGAGAVLLKSDQTEQESGILAAKLWSDGSFTESLCTDGGPGSNGKTGTIKMNGREVYREAIAKMSEAVRIICAEENIAIGDIDWVVAHQANERIINMVGEKLNIDPDKLIKTIGRFANNSAATIPIALSVSYDEGKIKKNDLVALTALGAGFSWGSALIRW